MGSKWVIKSSSFRVVLTFLVALSSLSMIESGKPYYKVELLNNKFVSLSSLILESREDAKLDLDIRDSNILYVRVLRCDSYENCERTELKMDYKKGDVELQLLDQENKLFLAKQVNYKISILSNKKNQKINFQLLVQNMFFEYGDISIAVELNIHNTQRFQDHIKAADYIRKFHLQDYGSDGGFLGLTGMNLDAIFREMSKDEIENKLGLIVEGKEIMGAHDLKWGPDSEHKIVAFSCAMCHFGRAAGVLIPGLGNKNVTPSGLAAIGLGYEETLKYKAHNAWTKLFLNKAEKKKMYDMNKKTKEILKDLQSELTNNLTQGLTSVNQTPLRFYRDLKEDVPENYPRAPSKAQAMWGLKEKRMKGGQFSDGGADGDYPMWAAGYDMGSLMETDYMLKSEAKLKKVQEAFGKLLPPAYPFEIDKEKALRGSVHFEKKCAECHSGLGEYGIDENGYPIYKAPKLIRHKYVKTEPERMHLFDGLEEVLKRHPLSKVLKVSDKKKRPFLGYYSPRLVGIWSRFPYLHNGSVPSLMALLTHPDERPKFFSLKNAGRYERFDQKNVGLTLDEDREEELDLIKRASEGDQSVYDITRDEHSNMGHLKGLDLSLEEKYELIEYLKTL